MSLTLQDLFAPIVDAGSLPSPRANASSANAAGDPFAALFDSSAAAAKPAGDSAPKSDTARRADSSPDRARADRPHPHHARSDRARSDDTAKPVSTDANASSADRTSSSSSNDQADANSSVGSDATSGSNSNSAATQAQATSHRKGSAHGATAARDGDNDADTGVNGSGVVNLFQVMLLAAQPTDAAPADATVTAPQNSVLPTTAAGAAAAVAVPTAPVTAPIAENTTAPNVPTAASDLAALLGDDASKTQPNAPATATTPATAAAPSQIPAQTIDTSLAQATTAAPAASGDIAIVSATDNVAVAAQAQAVPATTSTRATDGRPSRNDATTVAKATAASSASAIAQTSFDPPPAQTEAPATTGHTDAPAKNDLAQLPPNANPAAPHVSTSDPTAAPIGLPLADGNAAPAANAASIPVADPSATSPAAMPLAGAASIATPQQAQAVYAKATGRGDALPQVTIDQVTMHLAKAADDGLDRLTIHLKPSELGSIEVKLEMSDSGISKATITADRPDTLNLLQNSSHRLERALENAGIKADAGSLSFNLRGDGGSGYTPSFAQQGGNASSQPSYASSTRDDSPLPDAATIVGYVNSRAASGGVDIRV